MKTFSARWLIVVGGVGTVLLAGGCDLPAQLLRLVTPFLL